MGLTVWQISWFYSCLWSKVQLWGKFLKVWDQVEFIFDIPRTQKSAWHLVGAQ